MAWRDRLQGILRSPWLRWIQSVWQRIEFLDGLLGVWERIPRIVKTSARGILLYALIQWGAAASAQALEVGRENVLLIVLVAVVTTAIAWVLVEHYLPFQNHGAPEQQESPPLPSDDEGPPVVRAIVMKVSDKKSAPEDHGEPLELLVRWHTTHRRPITGQGLMFFTGRLDITNRSGRALSLEPRVIIRRDPHSIPDLKIRQLIKEQKPGAVEASLEIFGLPRVPDEVQEWGAKDIPYFPNPIPVGVDQTATGQMVFLLDEQFAPFAGTEYYGFDFLLIDLVSGHVAIMTWAHGYPD